MNQVTSTYIFIVTIFCNLIFGRSHAQNIHFAESALNHGLYLNYSSTYLGQGVSFYDFDEDGWDDLTLCQVNGPVILYRNIQGYFEPHFYFFAGNNTIASCWGDLDNDGKNDLIVSSYDNGIHIYKNSDNSNFMDITAQSNIMQQEHEWYSGIALSDMNRDGLLDIAVANYTDQGKNLYLINQGNLVFESLMGEAGFLNVQKHAFQPGFIDLNYDLWPDLYMINDFYEGNEMYWNYGELNISENDTAIGLGIQADAMSNSWCDFDKDGDLDLYVTNRFEGNYFMQQTENLHFQNIVTTSGTDVPEWCWSATWIDPENNGVMDLLVTKNSTDIVTDTSGNHFFYNQGDGLFIEDTLNILFPTNTFVSATGDFNNDGLVDLANSTRQGYNFELYENTTSTFGNYIKFRLEGHLSNRNGVGTHYDIWTNQRRHYGYTQAGENYIAQNSQNRLIGIGEHNTIDSIILKWPSGIVDKYYNLEVNQLLVLHESQNQDWYTISDTILCQNSDTIWIETSNFVQATWWDDSTDSTKFITTPGTYTFTLSAPFGQTQTFQIHIYSAQNFIAITTQNNICNMDSLGAIEIVDLITNQAVYNAQELPNATYPISIEIFGCPLDTSITILSNETWNWDLTDTIWNCHSEQIDWNYWDDLSDYTLLSYFINFTPYSYTTTWENNQGCTRDTIIDVYIPTSPIITTSSQYTPPTWLCELTIEGNDGPYGTSDLAWDNGVLNIKTPGFYAFHVIDRWGCTYEDTLSIEPIAGISIESDNKDFWLYQNPYLIGPANEKIQVFNSLGQTISATKENEKWILPFNSSPRWVYTQGQFFTIRWILDK